MNVIGQEEADTKMVAHIEDALRAGHRHIVVMTIDTDVVVVILMGLHQSIPAQYPDADVWVRFGPKKSFRYYHINADWGMEKARTMPFFHALTGSDVGREQLGVLGRPIMKLLRLFQYLQWNLFLSVTEASNLFTVVERFVCLLYES